MACSDIQEVAYENFELVICFQVRHVLINPKHILCDLYWMELDTETLNRKTKPLMTFKKTKCVALLNFRSGAQDLAIRI